MDYRAVNSMVIPIAGTMPTATTTTDASNGKAILVYVDFTKGLWQLFLNENIQEIFLYRHSRWCVHTYSSPSGSYGLHSALAEQSPDCASPADATFGPSVGR
ncbi:hypothetical protein L917_02171 [Phytophthora nicotianae]|uniref:Uncharacterized protein n=1 Tax=Phytophthora nicotianae TaxID=4792 RepID=W2LX28_PHYNI|nr:hypothetical protein L917_02171 [Phytophthora nicotianae]